MSISYTRHNKASEKYHEVKLGEGGARGAYLAHGLLDYMLKNSIIPKSQHGFVPKKSTATNLLDCLNDWTSNFDNNVATDIVYLDYSKCFDKVCHKKLLYKLSKYSISGSAFSWLESFLSKRVQSVKVQNTLSPDIQLMLFQVFHKVLF